MTHLKARRGRFAKLSLVKLTRYTDYALRILIQLARAPDRLQSIRELSLACDAPENHVMKVTPTLVRGRLVASARGSGGGMKLAKSADQIRIGDVVRLTEGVLNIGACEACTPCVGCGLPNLLAEAGEAFLTTLNRQSLADLLQDQTPSA